VCVGTVYNIYNIQYILENLGCLQLLYIHGLINCIIKHIWASPIGNNLIHEQH